MPSRTRASDNELTLVRCHRGCRGASTHFHASSTACVATEIFEAVARLRPTASAFRRTSSNVAFSLAGRTATNGKRLSRSSRFRFANVHNQAGEGRPARHQSTLRSPRATSMYRGQMLTALVPEESQNTRSARMGSIVMRQLLDHRSAQAISRRHSGKLNSRSGDESTTRNQQSVVRDIPSRS